MKILVIGAGINGVLTAHSLVEKGFDVEIIEESSAPATRATFANGCQLSFSHTTPMSISPSVFQTPFHRPFLLSKAEKFWLKEHKFFKNSSNKTLERFHILTDLAVKSKNAFDEIFAKYDDIPEAVGHSSGTVYLFSKRSQFEKRKQFFEIQKSQYGIDFFALNPHDAVEYEGSIVHALHTVKHAIFTPFDRTLNAFEFTKFMAEKFQKLGGKISYNTQIKEILHSDCGISSVQTNAGGLCGYDFYVYCGGASGLNLIKDFVPLTSKLQAVTGYSMTLDASYSNHCPEVNVIDFTNKMVYSRHGDTLRIAGFFDINPQNKEARLKYFYKKALETFPILQVQPVIHKWSENRVFTTDEIPIVKKVAQNFIINTAQGHLGITLSAGSAKKVLSIIQES